MTDQEKKQVIDFEKVIEVTFENKDLLYTALTHRSYLNEKNDQSINHNERIEFLGDAVLELIISDYLFNAYPERAEGDLTSFRAATVKTESLAETALQYQYGNYIFMSKGEEQTGGRERPYILANTFEAVLGAVYLDKGFKHAQDFVNRTLVGKIESIVENRLDIDAKSKLQEIAQEELKETPAYELVKAEGPDHDRIFTMKVIIGSKDFGEGSGASKQEAEQAAADFALENWGSRT